MSSNMGKLGAEGRKRFDRFFQETLAKFRSICYNIGVSLQIAVYRSATDKLHNAECRVQNAELMKSFRNGEKIFNGIYRCLCARKIVFRYRESCVLSNCSLTITV